MGKFQSVYLLVGVLIFILSGCVVGGNKGEKKEVNAHILLADERELEKKTLIRIDVRDPQTNEVIHSIIPWVMGLNTKEEGYKAEIQQWVKSIARGTKEKEGYDQRMIQDKIAADGSIIKGRPMILLDEAGLVESIMTGSEQGGEVELPLEIVESRYNPEEVPHLDEVVLASYTTYFNNGVYGRTKNIELSAAAINNVILGAGDHFSFNDVVGPRDQQNGYQKAMEIVNKELVEGIGGGVCQTSSTLYNAVDQMGVEYLEWHHHSKSIGYVPEGKDATVSYGGLDFRFKNKKDIPLLLKAYVKGGSLTVEVRTSKSNAAKL